jgi:2,3-bisphosphoglycerate-independent phosphoglycerate mutase
MKKILIILLDGIGDRIYKELGDLTPLEFAKTPNLDLIASKGASASVYPINPGFVPPSELAHFHLFGYEHSHYPGRAVLESLGHGVSPPEDIPVAHLGLRNININCGEFSITPWWPCTEDDDAKELIRSISRFESNGIVFEVKYIGNSDSLLIMHNGSEHITDSDPFMHTGLPVLKILPSNLLSEGLDTAVALNDYLAWTHKILSSHEVNINRVRDGKLPLNMTVTKWPGRNKSLISFKELNGLNGKILASAPMYKGMSEVFQMGYEDMLEHKCDPSLEISTKLDAARTAFSDGYDFVHLHTKLADEAAHSHSPLAKANAISAIDSGLSGLWEWPNLDNYIIAITADHCTPSHGPMLHSGESVPLSIMGEGVRVDQIKDFSERSSVGGSLGQLCSRDIMPILLNAANRSRFLGGRSSPIDGYGLSSHIPLKCEL